MEWKYLEAILIIFIVLLILYYYFTTNYNFWSSRGIPNPKPILLFGNFKDVILGKVHFAWYVKQQYDHFKDEPFFGIYARSKPILVVKDPDYITNILIKDFSSFADRGRIIHEKAEPLSPHLVDLDAERWRPLRNKLSPIFTSGKLKEMFHLISKCADHFEVVLDKCVKKNAVIECREISSRFTIDVIGVCAFGLNTNAIDDENSAFKTFGQKFFKTSTWQFINTKFKEFFPWCFDLIYPLLHNYEMENFFIGIIKDTMEYRMKHNITRNDFVDLLLEIKNRPGRLEITDALLIAQAFIFFVAGFETSSTTMSYALYELALNPSIQDKLRDEINDIYDKNDGECTYDTVKSMTYLGQVFHETLRKYPVITLLMRNTLNDYTLPGSKATIPKGTQVWIPSYAIHYDPDIYPNPETFDPERFEENSFKQIHPSLYLPFGNGPRNSIGKRFAKYQTQIALIRIIRNYVVEICDETCIPCKNNPISYTLQPIGGIKLKFTKI